MRAIPWISLVLAALMVLNPIGIEVIGAAFWGDPLSRAIWLPILVLVVLALAGLAAGELALRRRSRRRRQAAEPPLR